MEITVDGRVYRVYRSGKGIPVLMLHGITTYSFIWRKVAPLLSSHHELHLPDLLGCGDSSKDISVSYGLAARADRIGSALAEMGTEPVHLVGHDLGGGIAQILAVRFPQLFRSMTLINSVGYDFWPVQPISALRTPILRQLLMATLDLGALKVIVQRGLFHKDRADEELLELFSRPLSTPEGRKAFLHFARCLDNRDLMSIAPALQQLRLPTLVLRGDADVYLSASISERLVSAIPGARLERIASGGHFIQEDEPEWVAEKLLQFWREGSA